MYIGVHVKYRYSYQILMKFEFSWQNKYQISSKSVQWEPSCYMRIDGQTDMKKLIVAFRNSVKELKKAFLINNLFFLKRTGNAIKLNVTLFLPSRWCTSTYRKIFYRRHISAATEQRASFESVHIWVIPHISKVMNFRRVQLFLRLVISLFH